MKDRRDPQNANHMPLGRRKTDKIACPYCGCLQSSVTKSAPASLTDGYWRRRECGACRKRFTTEEVVRGVYDSRLDSAQTSLTDPSR